MEDRNEPGKFIIEDSENERTELCALCDVEVPLSFMEDHRNSAKHKACSIITQISLDRTRRHMFQTSPAHRPPRDNIFFCTACSCAVAVSKKSEHNTSETHKQSLLHDNMLNSLALIFETKENVKRVWEEQPIFRKIDRNEKGEELTIFRDRNEEIRVKDDENAIADRKIDRNKKEEKITIFRDRNEEIRVEDDKNAIADRKIDRNEKEGKELTIFKDRNEEIRAKDVDKAMVDNIAMFDADNAIAIINHAINTLDTNNIVKELNANQTILTIDTIIDEIARGIDKHEDTEAACVDNAIINVNDVAKNAELKETTAKQVSLTKDPRINENKVKYTGAINKTKNVAKDITKDTTINKNAKITDKRTIEQSINVAKEDVTNTIIDENAKKLFAGLLKKSNKVDNNIDGKDNNDLIDGSPQPSTSDDMTAVEYWMMMPNDDDDDVVQITTMSGAVLTVKVDNYHGFYTVGDKTACRICKVVCDKSQHCQDPQHLNKVMLPISDKHCVRKIDQHWQHCIICNEIIENSNAHAMCSEKHHTLLKKALIQDENTIQLTSSKNLTDESSVNKVKLKNPIHTCYVCKVSTTLTKNEHNNTKEHKLQSGIHYHIKKRTKSMSYVTCMVCQYNLLRDKIETDKHVEAQEHKDKYKKMMQENGMKYTDEMTFFCSICSEYIPILNEIMHIKDIRHINNKNINTGEERQIIVPPKTFYSLNANKKQFKLTANANNKQVTQKAEKNKQITQKEKNNKQITQTNIDNKQVTQKDGDTNKYTTEALYLLSNNIDDFNTKLFYCAICDVYFPKEALRKHVASERHRRFFMNPKEIAEQAKEKELTLKDLPPDFVKTKIQSQFKCKLCQVIITASIKNINEHVKGSRHRQMIKDREKSTSNACIHSTVASSKTSATTETSIKGNKQTTVANGKTSVAAGISIRDKTQTTVTSGKTSATTENTTETLKDLPPEIVKTEIDTELKCTLCQVFIPASIQNAKIHVEGLRHRKMLNDREKSTSSAYLQRTVASSKTGPAIDAGIKDNIQTTVANGETTVPTGTSIENNIRSTVASGKTSATTETNIKDNIQTTVKTIKTLKDLPPEIVKTEIDSELKCTLCQIVIPATTQHINEHVNGSRHRKMMKGRENFTSSALIQSTIANSKTGPAIEAGIKDNIQSTVAIGKTSATTETSIKDNTQTTVKTIKTLKDLPPEIVKTEIDSELKCTLCQIVIPATTQHINEHVNGSRHRKEKASSALMQSTVASEKNSAATETSIKDNIQTTVVSGETTVPSGTSIKNNIRSTVASGNTSATTETSIKYNIQTTVVAGTIISNKDDIQTIVATGKTSPDTGTSIGDNMPTTVASDKPSVATETSNENTKETTVASGKIKPVTEASIENNIQSTVVSGKTSPAPETSIEDSIDSTVTRGKTIIATGTIYKNNNTKTEHTSPGTFNALIQTTEGSDTKTIDIYIIGKKYKCCQPKDTSTGIAKEIAQSKASNSETNIKSEDNIQETVASSNNSVATETSIEDNMQTTVASDKPSVPTETNDDGVIQTTVTRGKTRAATETSIKHKTLTTVANGKTSPATETSIEDNIQATVASSVNSVLVNTNDENKIQTAVASSNNSVATETNMEDKEQATVAISNESVDTEISIEDKIQSTVARKTSVLAATNDENKIQTTLSTSNYSVATETNMEDKEQATVASSKISVLANTDHENKIQIVAPETINTNNDGIQTTSEDQACAEVERTPQLLKEAAEDSVDYEKDDAIEDSLSSDSEDYDDITEIEEKAKKFIVEYYVNLKRAIRPFIDKKDDDSKHVKCKLCDESIPNDLCTILRHTEGIKHINRYEALLLANCVKEDLYNYKCDACKVIFARKNLYKHLNGKRHEETTKVPSSEDMEHDIDDVFAALDRRRYLMKSIDLYTIKCELCNIVMQDDFEDLETHAKSRLHLLNFNGLMRENKISRNDDNLFCDFCEEDLDETDVLYHINSNSHRISITRTALLKVNDYECPFCLISIPNTENDKKNHDKSIRHTFQKVKLEKMVAAAVDEMLKLRRENELCNVYEEFISKTADIDKYNSSAKHEEKVQKLENERTGIITNSYSTISKVDLLDNADDIAKHLPSTSHKDKIKAGYKESTLAVKLENAAHVTIEGFYNFCKDTPNLAYHINDPNTAEHAESETTSSKDNMPPSGTTKLKITTIKNTPKSITDIGTCKYEPSTTARTDTEKLPTPSKSTQTDENKYTSRVFFCETGDATLKTAANVLYHVRSVEKKTNTYLKNHFNEQNNNDGATDVNLKLHIKMVDNEAETTDLIADNKANNEAELAASVTDNNTQNTQLSKRTHRKSNKRVLPGIAEVTSDVTSNDDVNTSDVRAHDEIETCKVNTTSNVCDVGKIEVQNPLFIKSVEDGATYTKNVEKEKDSDYLNLGSLEDASGNDLTNTYNHTEYLGSQLDKKNVEKEKDRDLLDLDSLEDASGTGITNTNDHSGYLGSQSDDDRYNTTITNNMKTDAQDSAKDNDIAFPSDKDTQRYSNDKIYLGSQLDLDLYEAAMITNGNKAQNSANNNDKAKYSAPTVFGSQLDVYLYKADTMKRNINTSATDIVETYNINVNKDTYTKDTDADEHFDRLRPWRPVLIPSRLGADTYRNDMNIVSDTDTKTDDSLTAATKNEVAFPSYEEYSEIHKSGINIDKEGKKDEKRFYTCKICKLAILNNGTDIKNHLKTSIHEYNLNQQLKKTHEEMKERKYFCDICKINVSKTASDLNKHNESLIHKQMFKYTIQKNNIKIRADRVCFCELCDLYFNKQTVASHVMKDSHIKLLKEAKIPK